MRKKLSYLLVYFVFVSTLHAGENLFCTWDGLEVDKLGCIWLIKKVIAPGATVVIHPRGQLITTGIQFDTPYSKISRKTDLSTFEAMLKHYHLTDSRLLNLGKLVHDIEINVWEEKIFLKSKEIEIVLVDLLERYKTNEEIIDRAIQYFDHLYDEMPARLKRISD